MQSVADLRVFDFAQPAVDVQQEVVEFRVMRPLGQPQVTVEFGGLDESPDLRPDRGKLRRIHRGDVGVLVEELLQPGDVAVRLGACHRGHKMSMIVAWARRLACAPSPGSLTRKGR